MLCFRAGAFQSGLIVNIQEGTFAAQAFYPSPFTSQAHVAMLNYLLAMERAGTSLGSSKNQPFLVFFRTTVCLLS